MKDFLYLVALLVLAAIYAIMPTVDLKAKFKTAFDDETPG